MRVEETLLEMERILSSAFLKKLRLKIDLTANLPLFVGDTVQELPTNLVINASRGLVIGLAPPLCPLGRSISMGTRFARKAICAVDRRLESDTILRPRDQYSEGCT